MKQPFAQTLVAGDTWTWTVSLDDHSLAAGDVLKYFFRGPGKLDVELTGGTDGQIVEVAATDTAALAEGTYTWACVVVDAAGKRTELARGTVEVLPNIEAAGEGYDGRSHVKKMLDAVRACLEGRASRVEQQYQVNGRSLVLLDPRTLRDLEGHYAARYRAEQVAAGQLSPNSNQVRARFTSPDTSNGGWR